MITKIKRQDCFAIYPKFPQANYYKEEFFFPKTVADYTLTISSRSLRGHIKILSAELTGLAKSLKYNSLIFLGDERRPWLYQDNEYKPVKEALEYLKEKNVNKRFNGGLKVDLLELPNFLMHLSWLTRCNAALPYYHFMDEKENIVGNICKYCNIHISSINNLTDNLLKKIIAKSEFEYLEGQCYNKYSKTSAIRGRQIII